MVANRGKRVGTGLARARFHGQRRERQSQELFAFKHQSDGGFGVVEFVVIKREGSHASSTKVWVWRRVAAAVGTVRCLVGRRRELLCLFAHCALAKAIGKSAFGARNLSEPNDQGCMVAD